MAIIKQYHKDTNTTYVYESTSYWDTEKQQSRSKRRVIGKLDPVTGEVIPTGKRGRKKGSASEMTNAQETNHSVQPLDDVIQEQLRQHQIEISTLKEQVSSLTNENRQLKAALSKAGALAEKLKDICFISNVEA